MPGTRRNDEARIDQLIEGIRNSINDNPRRRHQLSSNAGPWNRLLACLDTIEDCQLAVAAFSTHKAGVGDGSVYLDVMGLLQALYVQQDAALALSSLLGPPAKLEDYPRLREVRTIRDDIAHPTNRWGARGTPVSYISIIRASLSRQGCTVIRRYEDGRPAESSAVSFADAIEDQATCISHLLASITEHLHEEEARHKEAFEGQRLEDILEPADYAVQKLKLGGQAGVSDAWLAAYGAETIKGVLARLKDALDERGGLHAYLGITNLYEAVDYPLCQLDRYFHGEASDIAHDNEAYVFADFVGRRLEELQGMIREIDRDYSETTP